MLYGFMGALLRMDKSVYAIGDRPQYFLTGAEPGAVISWTSFKNGQPTGELNAQYGQYVGDDGSWSSGVLDPWPASYQGQWQKQVLLINPDGSFDQAQVSFRVGATGAAGAASQAQNGGDDFFSGSFDIPGLGPVPNLALVAGAGLLLLAIMPGGRR